MADAVLQIDRKLGPARYMDGVLDAASFVDIARLQHRGFTNGSRVQARKCATCLLQHPSTGPRNSTERIALFALAFFGLDKWPQICHKRRYQINLNRAEVLSWCFVPCPVLNQTTQRKGKPVMQFYFRIKNFSLTAVIGCVALLSVGPLTAQQPVAPTATLEVAPATIVEAQPNYVMEQPVAPGEIPFRPTMDRTAYDAAKARANSYAPLAVKPFTETFAPLATPVIRLTNFSGHSTTQGLRPPDTHGAVTAHFVQVTNSHIDMWTRQNTQALPLAKSVTLATFFGYTAQTLFDPRVVYDSTWNRWIVTADAFAESSTVQRFFIAVSTTADPTGSFFIYNLNVTFFVNDFFDFPQLGIDQDAVLFTANIFNGTSFHGADFFAVAKARLYNGLGFSVPVFTGLVGTLAPPIVRDQNSSTFLIASPPSGTTFSKYTATNTSKGTSHHGTGQYYCTFLLGSAECASTWNERQAVGHKRLEICECQHAERQRSLADPYNRSWRFPRAEVLPTQDGHQHG